MSRLIFAMLAAGVLIGAGAAGYYLQQQQAQQRAATSASATSEATAAPDHKTIIGQPRPPFSLPALGGEVRAISDWDGRILAINFWATWCQPCKEEIPEFVELQAKYRDQGVTFIGVAIDESEPVSDFIARYNVNYPVLIGEQAAIDAARAYGNRIGALPYTAFVDHDGKVVHVHRGRLPLEQADQLLQTLVADGSG